MFERAPMSLTTSPPCFAAMFTLVTITADQDGTTRTDRINLSLQLMKYLF